MYFSAEESGTFFAFVFPGFDLHITPSVRDALGRETIRVSPKDQRNKMIPARIYRRILGSIAAIVMSSCFSQTKSVDLPPATILPIAPADREAAQNAQAVSFVRPRDTRKEQVLSGAVEASLFPILINQKFVAENDPATWAGNGLVEGLENAGYKVRRVDSIQAADTPVVIAAELTQLSQAPPPSGIHFASNCEVRLAVGVRVMKAGQVLSDAEYGAEGLQEGGSCYNADTLGQASRKALEAVLAKAIPSIGLVLRGATQPAQPTNASALRTTR